ncbi:MAG TPA: hypothetical protein VKJ65_09855 [Phycisphaerae bacterium]|nr:hypothetical protein [Phycisphaerae bacterium]
MRLLKVFNLSFGNKIWPVVGKQIFILYVFAPLPRLVESPFAFTGEMHPESENKNFQIFLFMPPDGERFGSVGIFDDLIEYGNKLKLIFSQLASSLGQNPQAESRQTAKQRANAGLDDGVDPFT